MKIGIIGAGDFGTAAAGVFAAAGHEVALANSRGPGTLSERVGEIGENARAATVEEATGFGEIVLVSIPFGRYRELPAKALADKIVIDATNYYPDRDGRFEEIESGKTTSSELLAAHLGGARVVKAFNTIRTADLREQGDTRAPEDERRVIFLSGDDPEAKKRVAGLIGEIGFGPFDTGRLSEGGKTQAPGSAVYDRDLTVAEVRSVLQAAYG